MTQLARNGSCCQSGCGNASGPGLLKGVAGFDLFGKSEADARTFLLAKVQAALQGRAKPSAKPEFPGAGRAPLVALPGMPRFPGAPPRVWNAPPHNPHFTGRDTELGSLARALAADSTVTVHSVHGLGGVGKSLLAGHPTPAGDATEG